MGAWDTTVFGNDGASDFAGELGELSDPAQVVLRLTEALDAVIETDGYLDTFESEPGLAAAALVAAWASPGLEGDYAHIIESWPPAGLSPSAELRARAVAAIDRILAPGENELFELWDEAGQWSAVSADIARYRAALAPAIC